MAGWLALALSLAGSRALAGWLGGWVAAWVAALPGWLAGWLAGCSAVAGCSSSATVLRRCCSNSFVVGRCSNRFWRAAVQWVITGVGAIGRRWLFTVQLGAATERRTMCSQGAFGGALRCPHYARDLPRTELIEALKKQFIRRGFSLFVPPDAYDEGKWTVDEVSVFFQSGGSVKPRSAVMADAARAAAGLPPEGFTEHDEAAKKALGLPGPASIAGPGCVGPPFGKIHPRSPVAAPLSDRWGGERPLNDLAPATNGSLAHSDVAGPGDCGGAVEESLQRKLFVTSEDESTDDEFEGMWGF